MIVAWAAAVVLGQSPTEALAPRNTSELTQFALKPGADGASFDWVDQEDRVRGTVRPRPLTATKPIALSLVVGPLTGDFSGPVTIALESSITGVRTATTVAPTTSNGPKVWATTLSVPEAGAYWLEVSFRTTRFKTIRAPVEVASDGVPEGVGFAIALAVVALVVGAGTLSFTRRR